ncbi:MAG TPA: DUF4097 family beta strand repeat-containing protein, partial [Candidatus Baltobacteraceae bacterium]|nr:DUF4097 family beta strand repeat-containing protein [Candidatus Baltobacteraceae bacterium]
ILTQASSLHPEHYHATDTAVLDAGTAPHIVVDDRDSRIVVTPSYDGRVHVADQSESFGFVWRSRGQRSRLAIARTGDGVAVSRPSTGGLGINVLGYEDARVSLSIPPGSYLDVKGCDGADVRGLRAQSVSVTCQDGSLRVSDLAVQSGTLQTADGSIRVALAASDVTVHAVTGDGSLRFNGRRVRSNDDSDGAEGTFQLGSGSGRLEVGTHDGSIRITTTGVQ